MFGSERSPMHYGFADVSIPSGHVKGELESPSLLKLEFGEDPRKHVVLLRSRLVDKDRYLAELATRIRNVPDRSALIFVHRYNVSFEDAARRTAQIIYDLRFPGLPVFFSRPSKGETALYTFDETEIDWAELHLKQFLDDVLTRSQARNAYIIGHSMGNRALTRALAALFTERPALRPRVKEIILAAPDIDADVFRTAVAPSLVSAGRPITLYASSDDIAIQASMKVHGQPRLGGAGRDLVVMSGVETIDATGVDTSLMAHSYYGSAPSVLTDISLMVHNSFRAHQRAGLQQVGSPPSLYWSFIK
jgi:esterase/lipase superfamily enzyme